MRNKYTVTIANKPASYRGPVDWSLVVRPRAGAGVCYVFSTKAEAVGYSRMLRRKPAASPWHLIDIDWFPKGGDPVLSVTKDCPIHDRRRGMSALPDARYTARLEFCGDAEPAFVVRFCGEWVGRADSPAECESVAAKHRREFCASLGIPV